MSPAMTALLAGRLGRPSAGIPTPPPASITPDIFIDWAAQTPGTSLAARSDGGKINAVVPTGTAVVANDGTYGFPASMVNIYRVPWDTSPGTANGRVTGLPALQVGDTRNMRWYLTLLVPDATADSQTHPIQDGDPGSATNWTARYYNNPSGYGTIPAGEFRYAHGFLGQSFPNDSAVMNSITLPKNHCYRFETAFTLVTSTTFRFDFRIADAEAVNEPVLYTSQDMTMGGLGVTTLAAFMASNTLTVNNNTMFNSFNLGVNDQYASPGDLFAMEGGFAVATNQGFIGPYGSCVGEA